MKERNEDAFQDKTIKVPFFLPEITNADIRSVSNALKLPLLTDGPRLMQFETAFAKFTGSKYAIGVSNATAALHLTLKSFGLKKDDEVLVPDQTFVATANAVLLAGATPVIVDVDIEDMNISIESIKKSITSKTRAIVPVHLAGKVCKIEEIIKIAKKHDLFVVEDCAHAIGTIYKSKHVGNFGDAGCFSFYPTKNMTTLEGGMVITNSKKIAHYVKMARNHGITKNLSQRFSKGSKPWDYDVTESGFNYRLDEIRSSLGISQLRRIRRINLRRKRISQYYNDNLSDVEGIVLPKIVDDNSHTYHLYIIRITKGFKMSRDRLFEKFRKTGIRTSVHYKPLHEFSVLKRKARIYDKLDNTKTLYGQIISLPLYTQLTKNKQDLVINCIKS